MKRQSKGQFKKKLKVRGEEIAKNKIKIRDLKYELTMLKVGRN